MLDKHKFGESHFKKWAMWCNSYGVIASAAPGGLNRLLDHGFIVDSACVWGSDLGLVGHEIAIIARTYCGDDEIDNPPKGLKVVRLPDAVMGERDLGTAIAVVIDDISIVADDVLTCLAESLPANILCYALSEKMLIGGCVIKLTTVDNSKVRANIDVD